MGEWQTLAKAAKTLHCTEETIRHRLRQRKWPHPAIKTIKGKRCIDVHAMYAHFLKYGQKPPHELRKPSGYEDRGQPLDLTIDPEIKLALGTADPLTMDPDELERRVTMSGHVSLGTKRVVSDWAEKQQRRRKDEVKISGWLSPDIVRKMLREHVEFIGEQICLHDKSFAEEMLRFVTAQFKFDLTSARPEALALCACFYREDANRWFSKIDALVKEQNQHIQK